MSFGFIDFARRVGRKAMSITRKKGGEREIATNPLGQRTLRADKEIEDAVLAELRRTGLRCALLGEEGGLRKLHQRPDLLFVVDPLDGSENFKRGVPIYAFGISVAPYGGTLRDVTESYILNLVSGEEFYQIEGKGVFRNGRREHPSKTAKAEDAVVSVDFYEYGPGPSIPPKLKVDVLRKIKDYRRFGPDLIDMAYVATGKLDGFVGPRSTLSIVHASGLAMLAEECAVTDARGRQLDAKLDIDSSVSVVAAGTRELHRELLRLVRG